MVKRNPYRIKRARKAPPLSVQVAACLIRLGFVEREQAAKMTVKAILRLAEWDHGELHALGGSDHPSNFWPIPPWEHREKSKRDASVVAKVDRLEPESVEHAVKMEAKRGNIVKPGDTVKVGETVYTYLEPKKKPKRKWGSRPMQSRNTFEKRKKP